MPLKCGSESTDYNYFQLDEIDTTLKIMRRVGISELSPDYLKVFKLRGEILGRLGLRAPKIPSLIRLISGLSPGVIKVWYDPEYRWISEARDKPGAPPVYRHVSDEVAMAILKGELTKELEAELMTPDPYLGE